MIYLWKLTFATDELTKVFDEIQNNRMLQPKNSKSQPSHVVPPPLPAPFLSSWHLPKKSLICSTYFVSKEMDSGPHKTPSRPELDLARYFSIKVSKIYSTRSTRNLFFFYNSKWCHIFLQEHDWGLLIIAQYFVRKLLRLFFCENNDGNTWIASNQQENYIFHRKKVILRHF